MKMTKPHSLVAGGTRGIGLVLAELLVKNGHHVSILGRRAPEKKLPKGMRFWQADLTKEKALHKTLLKIVQWGGKLSRLVCLQRFKALKQKAWEEEIAISLTATRFLIDSLANEFHPAGDKSVVLVGSAAGSVIAAEQGLGYHVAKAGLNQMARFYAVLMGPAGIRVNVVSPGTVLKPENCDFYLGNTRLKALFKNVVPLGRMGTAQEIAEVIDFLGSSRASFITGQILLVDGGVNLLSTETLARYLFTQK